MPSHYISIKAGAILTQVGASIILGPFKLQL